MGAARRRRPDINSLHQSSLQSHVSGHSGREKCSCPPSLAHCQRDAYHSERHVCAEARRDDERSELTPGSFGYMPAKMVHDAWTKEDGAMYFITVDGPFDINWVK